METIILAESFPLEIALVFSELCRTAFPSVKHTSVANLGKPKPKAVVIEGGRSQYHKEIIQWMLACCDGAGVRQLKVPPSNAFWYNANMLASAQAFKVEILEQELSNRVSHIVSKQVHSDDIRMVYTNLPRGHPIRTMASNSIGAALQEKRLHAYAAYAVLKREFPEFDEDLTAYMAVQKAKRVEAQEAERAERRREKKVIERAARKARSEARREEQAKKKRAADEMGQYYWKDGTNAAVPLLDLAAGSSSRRRA